MSDATAGTVVCLVGSAGGLAAVNEVLSGLPEEFAAAVVVLIHQQPDRVSHLADILDRRSAMPVRPAEDGDRLAPGHVLVVPNGVHGLLRPAGDIRLVRSGKSPPSRPSADLLLCSLAVACGERAIAVVLSGNGHDGATGATAVGHLGGTVLATDEATSETFSMPRATAERDAVVHHVVGQHEVASRLLALVGPG